MTVPTREYLLQKLAARQRQTAAQQAALQAWRQAERYSAIAGEPSNETVDLTSTAAMPAARRQGITNASLAILAGPPRALPRAPWRRRVLAACRRGWLTVVRALRRWGLL